ncbi:MAG: Ig-like domain-containing protein [Oscillospiraceae bacterium]|nr:Ig-like domain-containing protein [Oscillospiraceae bacterium]
MKRKIHKITAIAIILALSLSLSGIALGTDYQPPSFTTQPNSQSVIAGRDVILTVAVDGTPSPTLQWQISVNAGQTWSNIEGQTGTTLRLGTVALNQNGHQYRVVATNSVSEVFSNVATLMVNDVTNAQRPVIVNEPGNATVTLNTPATLSVTAEITDGGILSYQWFSNTENRNTGGTLIQGATSRTFTPPTTREGTVYYYAVVTNTNNNVSNSITANVVSSTARVTVNQLVNAQVPYIANQPGSDIITIGGSSLLSVTARITDNGTLSYQWFRNDTNSNTGGTAINGETGATFAPPTSALGVRYYYVIITNTNNNVNGRTTASITSDVVPVSVITTPDAPANLDTIVSDNQVELIWNAPENDGGNDIIGYQVSDNVVTLWIEANGTYSHTFTGLNSDTEYTFMVRAVNAAGTGEVATIRALTPEEEVIFVTGVSLDRDALYLLVDEYEVLIANIYPENADVTTVRWSSSDTSVATVDRHGVVTAVAPGTAIITVTTLDGSHTADSTVYVASTGNDNLFLWIGLGALAPLGTGTGIFFWRRSKKAK